MKASALVVLVAVVALATAGVGGAFVFADDSMRDPMASGQGNQVQTDGRDDVKDDRDDDDDVKDDTVKSSYIGTAKAKEIALAHAKVAANQISDYEIEMDSDDGVVVYEIEFDANGYEYEYEIDARTGAIYESERDWDDDCDDCDDDDD